MIEQIPVIETVDLKKFYKTKRGMLHAVDGINLRIIQGQTMGVVGESGCEIGRASCRERV